MARIADGVAPSNSSRLTSLVYRVYPRQTGYHFDRFIKRAGSSPFAPVPVLRGIKSVCIVATKRSRVGRGPRRGATYAALQVDPVTDTGLYFIIRVNKSRRDGLIPAGRLMNPDMNVDESGYGDINARIYSSFICID